jgi:hypothetical protein
MNYLQQLLELSQQQYFPQLLSLFNVILIFATALVAYLSWKAAKRANELQLLPLLSIYFKGQSIVDRKIRIRNIGTTPAYDIKIESFRNIITDIQHVWELKLLMSGTNVLVPDEEKDLIVEATDNGKKADMGDFMIFHLDPEEEHQRKRIGLIVTFRNAEGNHYYSEVETGVGGLFVKPSRKINLWGKSYLSIRNLLDDLVFRAYKFKWRLSKPYIA